MLLSPITNKVLKTVLKREIGIPFTTQRLHLSPHILIVLIFFTSNLKDTFWSTLSLCNLFLLIVTLWFCKIAYLGWSKGARVRINVSKNRAKYGYQIHFLWSTASPGGIAKCNNVCGPTAREFTGKIIILLICDRTIKTISNKKEYFLYWEIHEIFTFK